MKLKVFIVILFLSLIAVPVMAQSRSSRQTNVRVVVVCKGHRSLIHKRYSRCRSEYFLKYKMNRMTRSRASYGKHSRRNITIRRNKRSSQHSIFGLRRR